MAGEFAAGAATVAFGTLGDPNLYSTFSYLAQTVRDLDPEVTVETVAGITAMQDLASRAGISLAEGTEPVTLVPLNGGVEALDQALARGGTVVGYKVGAAASPAPGVLRERLQAAGRLDGAVIGARLGLAGELIAPAADLLPPAAASPRTPPPPTPPPRPQRHSGHSVFVHPDRPAPRGARGASLAQPPSAREPRQANTTMEHRVAGAGINGTSMPLRSAGRGRAARDAGAGHRGQNRAPRARNRPQGACGVRGGGAGRPGPADPPRRARHRRR